MATSFSGERRRSTQWEPPTMGIQLVSFITCGCESSASFFCNLQSRARTHALLVICLYELLGNPTTLFIEPPGSFQWFEVKSYQCMNYTHILKSNWIRTSTGLKALEKLLERRNGYFSVSWIKSLLIWSPLTLVKKHKFIILAPTLYEYEMWNNFKWLGWPLWNICVTNDHGYVPLFVNTSRFFPHSWLITGFVTRLTRRVSLMEQELLTLPGFSVICMLCRSLFVLLCLFIWPLCCLFFFDIRIMIAPLVSSNSS